MSNILICLTLILFLAITCMASAQVRVPDPTPPNPTPNIPAPPMPKVTPPQPQAEIPAQADAFSPTIPALTGTAKATQADDAVNDGETLHYLMVVATALLMLIAGVIIGRATKTRQ